MHVVCERKEGKEVCGGGSKRGMAWMECPDAKDCMQRMQSSASVSVSTQAAGVDERGPEATAPRGSNPARMGLMSALTGAMGACVLACTLHRQHLPGVQCVASKLGSGLVCGLEDRLEAV